MGGKIAEPIDPKIDDIKREFHPHSQRKATLQSLQDYRTSESSACRGPPTNQQPWLPFRTRLDFEVSEFAQEAMLNQNQVNTLVSLIRRCAAYIDGFTLTNHADMNKQWDLASKKCTQFQKFDITVPDRKGEGEQTFEMHARPLWDWARDLIQDPSLSSYFVWDAERAYKYDGDKFVRFFTEPWTANALWDVQSKLLNDKAAKSCPYILYADKSKLSSFGTQKGYPVVARLVNTVLSIRNSNGCWGGGQIVGWLPVVVDDSDESGKKGYADFKNAVWHASFYKLLESIVEHSKTGIWTPCGDGELRWLFPMLLILASDYEEACVMALIRGLQALYPCPICYVKKEEQADHTVVGRLRTAAESQDVVREGRKKKTAEEREVLLKNHSLRNVENIFWNIANSDPHKALSFDRLHAHASGLWGGHLFPLLKRHTEAKMGRASAKIDKHFSDFPRWRGLHHFDYVTNISFNDGSKHEDIAKMMVFAAHTVLTDKLDLLLLQCIRSYVELDIYASFKLHTTDTIAAGRRAHEKFGEVINVNFEDKNWDFPKMHSHRHLFDDIENKGVTLNFGTKIDEAMHGPARATYLRQTNFRDVADQILRADHRRLVGKFICDQINDLDGLFWGNQDDIPSDLEEISNVLVGSKQKSTLFSAIELEMQTDLAFHNFRIRFSTFVSNFLQVYGHGLPDGKLVRFTPDDEVIPFRFLNVFFQSLDNWEDDSDYLRCSPMFYGYPRYDAAIVKTSTGTLFAQLIYIFACRIGDKVHAFALIQPMDAGTGQLTSKDKVLGFYRVRAKPRQNSEFISVHSIIRGALLIPAGDKHREFLVVDVVDPDMFLRLKSMYPLHS
ncbi:hypothetical protein C8J57DRAFT_1438022 [Mycena rebaudengoi]|nr:hypothetical protein C8J57DRAFT_1438022 [Mycena rebaudengoi]